MSDFGLLPIIQVDSGRSRCRRMRSVYVSVSFSARTSTAEEGPEAGAGQLVTLLQVVALGDEKEALSCGKLGKGVGDTVEKLDLMIGDSLGEADDGAVAGGFGGTARELLEAGDERVAKALQAVAALGAGCSFHAIELFASLVG